MSSLTLWLSIFFTITSILCSVETSPFNRWYRSRFSNVFKGWRRQAIEKESEAEYKYGRLPRDPEALYTPTQVIINRGYPAETHEVTTEDGYILELHRIPPRDQTSPRKVVFLQHGVLESSGTWMVNPSVRSLPFLLADKGYDVWLGNMRGNRFSKKHTKLSTKSAEYWQFSWDEMGIYDIPAVINYILKTTGQSKLSYVGHSLGCGIFFIAMVKRPELNSKIDIMIALAPLSSFANFNSHFRMLTPYVNPIEALLSIRGTRGWLDNPDIFSFLSRIICEQTYSQARFCRHIYIDFAGPNQKNFDPAIIPRSNSNVFRGTSLSVIAQFAQNYNAGEVFQAYDYGAEDNRKKYGSTKPAIYNLTEITAPIYVFSGNNDLIVTPKDVDWLLKQLERQSLVGSTRFEDYNHLDFIWGLDVKERLYDSVLALLPPP